MNRISELFGLNCENKELDFEKATTEQMCPYTKRVCTKMRKSNPNIKIGTCSVRYQNQDIIICPFRMIENNGIFVDCLNLMDKHEQGNDLYIIPEVQIPGGFVDYFLVSVKDEKIIDFVGIELQAMDTTGSVWPYRQRFLGSLGIKVSENDLNSKKSFGINWKMTMKTILVQLHHKCKVFEYLNKHLVLVVQKQLFEHMKIDFNFDGINGVSYDDPVHIHSYDFGGGDNKLKLSLHECVSTDSVGIANCLGLNTFKKLELQDLVKNLGSKLTKANCLKKSCNSIQK